uniref:Uncharacterized protein n=1 Tax=Ditylenchus dipsaci TaxID=166011 RepID=A0A915DFH8_9BILA
MQSTPGMLSVFCLQLNESSLQTDQLLLDHYNDNVLPKLSNNLPHSHSVSNVLKYSTSLNYLDSVTVETRTVLPTRTPFKQPKQYECCLSSTKDYISESDRKCREGIINVDDELLRTVTKYCLNLEYFGVLIPNNFSKGSSLAKWT